MKIKKEKVFEIPRAEIEDAPDSYYIDRTYFQPWLEELKKNWMIAPEYVILSDGPDLEGTHYKFTMIVHVCPKKGNCQNCGQEIKIAIFKGEDWCCDDCRKALGKDVK